MNRIEQMPAITRFTLQVRDCVEAMKQFEEKSVDLVVTSPPYNLGIKYRHYKDGRKTEDYLRWSREWGAEVRRVLKDDGSFFLNLGACPSSPLLPHQLILAFSDLFVVQNTFHWIKSITVQPKIGEPISVGHFKPIRSKRYVNDCHEFVFHLTRTGEVTLDRLGVGVPYSDKSNIARWGHTKGYDLRCRGNNWFIPYQTILSRAKDRPHPATFPTELAVNCIKVHGFRSDLVMLDPFLGIGHSAMAAKTCGIGQFIGFDIDPEYVDIARATVGDAPVMPRPKKVAQSKRKKRPSDVGQTNLFGEELP